MANWYVYSGAAGTGTGADWANAKTTIAAAATASAAGDTIYVAHDHSEVVAAASTVTITFPGTAASPNRVICVNRGGSVPPVAADIAATAVLSGTGSATVTISGSGYFYGLIFNMGSVGSNNPSLSIGTANAYSQTLEACQFNFINTSSTGVLNLGSDFSGRSIITCKGCSYSAGTTVSYISSTARSRLRWYGNGQPFFNATAAIPSNIFNSSAGGLTEVFNTDFSAMGSGKTLANPGSGFTGQMRFTNCKLGTGAAVATTPTADNGEISVVGCNVAGGNVERNEKYTYRGILVTETTIIRTGGASDGTTPFSWKVTTTANAKQDFPFETFEGAIWNTATGAARTLSIEIGGPAALTNADVSLEAEYLGSAGSPVASFVSSGPATPLTAGAALTASGAAWGSSPGTTYTLSVALTPQMVGLIRWRVKIAKPSATIYIDPKPTLT